MQFSLRRRVHVPLLLVLVVAAVSLGWVYSWDSPTHPPGSQSNSLVWNPAAASVPLPKDSLPIAAIAGGDNGVYIGTLNQDAGPSPSGDVASGGSPGSSGSASASVAASGPAIEVPAPLAPPAAVASPSDQQAAPLMKSAARETGVQSATSVSASNSEAASVPAAVPVRAANLFENPYVLYLAGVGVIILLFLNVFQVDFGVGPGMGSEVYKTLSSGTRVEMLHALHQRRKTLTELAKHTQISLPGAKQHLELLEQAGLVRKLDEGRKWKYYELTDLGKRILTDGLA